MKEIKKIVLLFMVCLTFISCSNKPEDTNNVVSNEVGDTSIKPNNEKAKEFITEEELNTELNNQPMIVVSTEYIVQDLEFKALYPDVLNAIIQNKSGTDIKNLVIGFVAWDKNNFPVKIQGQYDYNGGDYYTEVNCSDVNMINNATFGEGGGLMLSENNKISKFKAIVVSYIDFDGNTWNNPLIDDFKALYVDKKLVE